jgi:hypothetical protein
VPFRLRRIARALAHVADHGDRAWLTQPRDIYESFSILCPPPEHTSQGDA